MALSTHISFRTFSLVLMAIGLLLLVVNSIGLFHYTTVESNDPHILDDSPIDISEDYFWENAYRRPNEHLELYLVRLTELISKKMLSIDNQYTKPTIFENWILWIYSQFIGYYEWSNTKKAVRLGGGYCSQHAIVFNNILREQDIQSRIIKLGGHVLNEVLVDRRWKVYDSDYNVVFNASLRDLENDPVKVYEAYLHAGRPADEAKHWQEVFATADDNWHYKKTKIYRGEKYYIEVASLYLIWVVPMIMIMVGLVTRNRV